MNPSIGWFIGWIEQNKNTYIFAMNIDIYDASMLAQREGILKKSLYFLDLLK